MPCNSNSHPLASLPHCCQYCLIIWVMRVVIGSSPSSSLSSCDHFVHGVVDTDMPLRISSLNRCVMYICVYNFVWVCSKRKKMTMLILIWNESDSSALYCQYKMIAWMRNFGGLLRKWIVFGSLITWDQWNKRWLRMVISYWRRDLCVTKFFLFTLFRSNKKSF